MSQNPNEVAPETDDRSRIATSWKHLLRSSFAILNIFSIAKLCQDTMAACVGQDDELRKEALYNLREEPHLRVMVYELCTFIVEGVRVYLTQLDLVHLTYLMEMLEALLSNPHLNLGEYLNVLLPRVLECLMTPRQAVGSVGSHWELRKLAARINEDIINKYGNPENQIRVSVLNEFLEALEGALPLQSVYGAIAGYGELTSNSNTEELIIPYVSKISTRLETALKGTCSEEEKASARKVQEILVEVAGPVLKSVKPPTFTIEQYKEQFGFLGEIFHDKVIQLRNANFNNAEIQQQPEENPSAPELSAAQNGNGVPTDPIPTVQPGPAFPPPAKRQRKQRQPAD